MSTHRIFTTAFASVYPHYVQKAERKHFATFFAAAPAMHPNTAKITGVVCGVRVEAVEEPLMQQIRWLDKLVDELAKGKAMEKMLRT